MTNATTYQPARRPRGRQLRLSDPNRRMSVAFTVVVVLLLVVGGRLVQLQGLDGTRYATAAEQQRLTTIELPAARGAILDRDGNPLAYTVQARAIFADPAMIDYPARTALAIAPIIGVTPDVIQQKIAVGGRFVYLDRGLDPAVAQQVLDLELPGIGVLDEQRREYPATTTGAQVVGFVNSDGTGLAGIEDQFDQVLTGTPGSLSYERGQFGLPIPAATQSRTDAIPGSTVQLTLDEDIQYQVEQAIAIANETPGVSTVQMVVQDARTGEVIAMAGNPGYNAASPGASDPTILGNPTVSNVIEPGSVNKMVTFAAALDQGLITPDSHWVVPDHLAVSDISIGDAWAHQPTDWTATGVFGESSNVGTVMLAERLGSATLEDYLHRFGLGNQTGIELPAESRGILPPSSEWSGSQAATIPFGQGISVSVLQMASMYQAVANDGVLVPPRIVDAVIGPDGSVLQQPPADPRRVISEEAAADLQYMLEGVTSDEGTGPLMRIDGYRVAGKTGTAQRPNPECSCYEGGGYWATFAGFAPADDPRYVVAISIEQPTGDQHGGIVAAPAFTSVMSYLLQQGGVTPSGNPAPEFHFLADDE